MLSSELVTYVRTNGPTWQFNPPPTGGLHPMPRSQSPWMHPITALPQYPYVYSQRIIAPLEGNTVNNSSNKGLFLAIGAGALLYYGLYFAAPGGSTSKRRRRR